MIIHFKEGEAMQIDLLEMTAEYSAEVFSRSGKIERIEVHCKPHL